MIHGSLHGQGVPPANDRFSRAIRLDGVAGSLSGSNRGATMEKGEPVPDPEAAGKSVWYRWRAPYPIQARFQASGVDFIPSLAVLTGNSLSSLDLLTADALGGELRVSADPTQELYVRVDSPLGFQGTFQLSWSSIPANDLFERFEYLQGPIGEKESGTGGAGVEVGEFPPIAADVGGTIWFAWAPSTSGQASFETRAAAFNPVLAVFTGSELGDLQEIAINDDIDDQNTNSRVTWQAEAGERYRICVGGRSGETGRFRLAWTQQLPPPKNDSFSGASTITGIAGLIEGHNLGATAEESEPHHAGEPAAASVWFRWTAPRTGLIRFNGQRGVFSARLAAYLGDTLLDLISAPGVSSASPAELNLSAQAGVTYSLAIDGSQGAVGGYTLEWLYEGSTTAADNFANARRIYGAAGLSVTENFNATLETDEPPHAGDRGGKSIWFRWTAPTSFRVVFKTSGSNFDTLLAVYTGENFSTPLTEVASNDDDDQLSTSRVTLEATAGVTYHLAVDAFSDNARSLPGFGTVNLSWRPSAADLIATSPGRGLIGSEIRITGIQLESASSVTFNGIPAAFKVWQGQLLAMVPSGASTGIVTVAFEDGSARETQEAFQVIPGSPPQIQMRRLSAVLLRLAWSSQFPDFRMERASDLTQDSDWLPCPPPVQVGGELVVTEPISSDPPARWFRLRLP